jgi:hypothetical protein
VRTLADGLGTVGQPMVTTPVAEAAKRTKCCLGRPTPQRREATTNARRCGPERSQVGVIEPLNAAPGKGAYFYRFAGHRASSSD